MNPEQRNWRYAYPLVPMSLNLDDVCIRVPIATSRIRATHVAIKHDVLPTTADGSVGLPPKLIQVGRVRTMVREPMNTGWIVVGIDPGNHDLTSPLRPNSLPIRFGWNIVAIV